MTNAFARALSILGHPMLVLPLAALALARTQGDGGGMLWLGLGFGLFAATVMSYSWWQVHRGRWAHVDASAKHERGALNRFLLIALTAGALLAAAFTPQRELALGLGLSAGLIAIAMFIARWCKLSLHMAFAVFAAALLSPLGWQYAAAGILFAGAIAWSRLALKRHTPADLLAGALAGALAGWAFWFAAAHSGG
jgi:membrane-associated phospholipid phosphatase